MKTRGGFYISQIKQLQDRIFEKLLTAEGLEISGAQGRILFVLWQQDRLTVNEISKKTSLANNTVSVVIDGMVQKGMLLRQTNPLNRRQTFVLLTEYAQSLYHSFEKVSQQMNTLFYSGFTVEEKDLFEAYLERILHTLQKQNI